MYSKYVHLKNGVPAREVYKVNDGDERERMNGWNDKVTYIAVMTPFFIGRILFCTTNLGIWKRA